MWLIHATSGVNLKCIMLSEGMQAQKEWFLFNYMIEFIGHSGKGKTISKETDQGWLKVRDREWVCEGAAQGNFRGLRKLFCLLIAVMITRLHICWSSQNIFLLIFIVCRIRTKLKRIRTKLKGTCYVRENLIEYSLSFYDLDNSICLDYFNYNHIWTMPSF